MQEKGMAEIEMFTLAHLLQTCVFIHNTDDLNWCRYSAYYVNRTLNDQMTMYINHPPIILRLYILFNSLIRLLDVIV